MLEYTFSLANFEILILILVGCGTDGGDTEASRDLFAMHLFLEQKMRPRRQR